MISTLIITKNEEIHLQRLIDNVKNISNEIIILDSYSTDKTKEIALDNKCKFFQRTFDNFSNQRNYLLNNFNIKNEWILFMDGDELLTSDLIDEIKDTIDKTSFDCFFIKRRFIWKDKWIKRGYYPRWFLRLGKKNQIYCDNNPVNEHLLSKNNNVGYLKHDFVNQNLNENTHWFKKHLIYAEFEKDRYFSHEISKKRRIWNRLPLFFRPFILIIYRFLINLVFLDGLRAIEYHFYHSFIYKMIIDYKILKKIFNK